jgi:hypothetical protein
MNDMKKQFIYRIVVFLLIPILFNSCSNNKTNNPIKSNLECKVKIESENEYYHHTLENEVINLTIKSIIDSLANIIKLGLGMDYPKYRFICVRDSLYDFDDFGDYSFMEKIVGVDLDSMKIYNTGHTKLEVFNKALSGGKELKVTTREEYYKIKTLDHANRVLLIFSRVHFNRKYEEALFTVALTTSLNTGASYAIYAKKVDNEWLIKRIIISSIS